MMSSSPRKLLASWLANHAWGLLITVWVVTTALQCALALRLGLAPTDATASSVSSALGLFNGRGLTAAQTEFSAAWSENDPQTDLAKLYDPTADRQPAPYPLPGQTILYVAMMWLTGSLKYGWIVATQIVLHGLLALLFARELMFRNRLQGVLTGLLWMLFAPMWRLTIFPTYDSWTSFVSLGLVIAALAYLRRRTVDLALLCGLVAGFGLWVRDYYFLLALFVVAVVLFRARPGKVHTIALVIPIAVLLFALTSVRSSEDGVENKITRGGFWHTFMAGIGQFPNAAGLGPTDGDVMDFAEARSPEGRSFRFMYSVNDPEYNRILREAALEHLANHPGEIVRNIGERCLWLLVPALCPSLTLVSERLWLRMVLIMPTVVLSLLAVIGFYRAWRLNSTEAWVLLGPWLCLFPLTAFYLIAKVVVAVYFVHIAFASFCVALWLMDAHGFRSKAAASLMTEW